MPTQQQRQHQCAHLVLFARRTPNQHWRSLQAGLITGLSLKQRI
jgi:hypothetical protein